MAPFIPSSEIVDLSLSSLELDSRSAINNAPETILNTLSKRDGLEFFSFSSSKAHNILTARDDVPTATKTPNYSGAIDPTSINMKGIQALFALIGACFVLGAIWFFFWAKNGGFQWRKGDWDDYKSTVLRRKGPNGTTLSNATKSTRLGGGSVVGEGYSDDASSTVSGTMTATMTELSSEAPIIKEKQRRARKETTKERKVREVKEAQWEGGHDQDMRAYRHERPARVGGINKDSDALHYGTDYTDTDPSVMNSHRSSRQQPRQPSSRHASPEKRSTRRDFSYGNDAAFSNVSSQREETASYVSRHDEPRYEAAQPPVPPHRPGRYHSPSKQPNVNENRRSTQYANTQNVPGAFHESSDIGDVQSQHTKSYHHPLPNLNGQGRGFRRDRRDSLDD